MDLSAFDSLLQADAYPHPVVQLNLRETHISRVILTGDFAYKIKKPVNFGFLDFSTLEKRLNCCREEVRLNRRSCPNIYLDVVPVVTRAGRLYLHGAGEIVDYAVKMRQFDADATLADRLQQNGAVTAESLQALGYRLAEFHADAARTTTGDPWGSAEAVLAPVWENFHQIAPHLSDPVAREQLAHIEAWSRRRANALLGQFEQRRQQGRVRELHGDLHAGNIAWIDGQWQPFDCIEFNPNLRWIDTASDLAFLLMDLECKGFRAQANRILNAYLEFNADYDLLPMLDFYRVYRALVRAKVAILRLQQADISADAGAALQREFAGYLNYCEDLIKTRLVFLALTSGVSGSGKSTVARCVAAETDAIQLRSDVTRKRLCGLKPLQSSSTVPGGIYTDAISRQTFTQLRDDASGVLAAGFPVIVDATFLRVAHRAPFLTLAWQRRVPAAILLCQAQRGELERRIQERQQSAQDPSEADANVMAQQLQQQEALTAEEITLAVDASRISRGERFLTLLQRNPDIEDGT